MPRDGLFAVVRAAGDVRVGDTISVLFLGDGTCDRTPSAMAEFEAEKAAEAADAAASANPRLPRARSRDQRSGESEDPVRPVR